MIAGIRNSSVKPAMECIQAGIRGNSINGNERMRLSGDATLFLEKHKLALTMHRIMLTFHSPGDAQNTLLYALQNRAVTSFQISLLARCCALRLQPACLTIPASCIEPYAVFSVAHGCLDLSAGHR